MGNSERDSSFFFTVLFFGGLWGLVEASLGYLLHVLPELMAIPAISGLILFPIGLFFMVKAMQFTGRSTAITATALVAAALKVASAAAPFIAFRFVRNPAIAILTEGTVAWLVLRIGQWNVDYKLPIKALILSMGWRSLFLAVNIGFGLSGIANKPMGLQGRFVFVDGTLDAAVIVLAALVIQALSVRRKTGLIRRSFGPLSALAALLTGIGGQMLFGGL